MGLVEAITVFACLIVFYRGSYACSASRHALGDYHGLRQLTVN